MLAAILAEAERAGTSPQEAASRALSALRGAHNVEAWRALLAAALLTVAQTSGQRTTQRIRASVPTGGGVSSVPDYDASDPDGEIAALSAEYTPTLAAGITHTNAERTGALFAALLAAGVGSVGVGDLASGVADRYAAYAADDGWASVIADTTTVLGWEAGAWDAATQATAGTDAEIARTWTAVGDAKTRPEHAEADGQTVGLNEPFTVGGEALMYPCDPGGSAAMTANCRCSVEYSIAGGGGGGGLTDAEQAALDDAVAEAGD